MNYFHSNFLHTAAALAIMLTTALGTGCAASGPYFRPTDPSQTKYVQTPDGEGTPQVSFGGGPPDAWWTLLGSTEIDRLVSLALQNNQSIAGAQAHLAAARERIRAARGALYPQVDAAVGGQRTRFGAPVLGPLAKDFPIFSAYAAGPEVCSGL